jgi:hypothetical protein
MIVRGGTSLQAVLWREAGDESSRPTGCTLMTWHLDPESAAAEVCDRTVALTADQWRTYFDELPFRSTCP